MVVNVEDAGFEIRDQIMWVYGSGFPKSHNIGKAVDKKLGNEREVLGEKVRGDVQKAKQSANTFAKADANKNNKDIFGYGTEVLTKGDSQWEGWGTALKPAHEPIVMARKPITEKTVADNVIEYGTGGINIDGCRILYGEGNEPIPQLAQGKTKINSTKTMFDGQSLHKSNTEAVIGGSLDGRFPANFIHDGSDEVLEGFPEKTIKQGKCKSDNKSGMQNKMVGGKVSNSVERKLYIDDDNGGSAARFFYCPKANKKERNEGADNNHPTVKPVELMKYLCRLITPKGGIVLDPFMGSGSTGIAAKLEGFSFVGIELDTDYLEIAKARIDAHELEASLGDFLE
jgi:site-specific DNA-methyltransferase (adenine-specific)